MPRRREKKAGEDLYEQYKRITFSHIKRRGLSRESIGEILFAMHVATSEVFQALVKVGEEVKGTGRGPGKS